VPLKKMQIEFINPLLNPLYTEFINSHADASFFHSPTWARVLHETYGFIPQCIACIENGQIRGLISFMETHSLFGTKRCVSLPFSDFCEPLFENGDDFQKTFEALTRKAQAEKWVSIQLRGGTRLHSSAEPYDTIITHDIDLTQSEPALFQSFRSSTKRNIRNAKESGLAVTHETSLEATREFYRLQCLTRKEHGLPPQPWIFFKNLHEKAISRDMGFITLAAIDKKFIAGYVFLIHGNRALYKYGASDKVYQNLRPNNLVLWEGIRKCQVLGCRNLNLGRTEMHNIGLLQFKQGFTQTKSTINYYNYNIKEKRYLLGSRPQNEGLKKAVISKFPIPILQCIGSAIYKFAG
jgi:hypothetical protein